MLDPIIPDTRQTLCQPITYTASGTKATRYWQLRLPWRPSEDDNQARNMAVPTTGGLAVERDDVAGVSEVEMRKRQRL